MSKSAKTLTSMALCQATTGVLLALFSVATLVGAYDYALAAWRER